MKNARPIEVVAVWLAVVGFCLPQVTLAATVPAQQAPVIVDVALMDGGVLVGQVVDPQGTGLAGIPVSLRSGGQELGASKTVGNGGFAFRGLRSGVYQVVAGEGHGAYRLWESGMAPPAAQPGALIVSGVETVRGQNGVRRLRNMLANPWIVAGIIATAVAVPVAIHNSDSPSTP